MHSVAAAFDTALAADSVNFTELYSIAFNDGTTGYYTPHPDDISWNSITYTSAPIKRGPISRETNFQSSGVSIEIANVSEAVISDVQNNKLERATVTIKRIPYNETYASDMEILLFVGFANVEFNRSTLSLRCMPVTNLLGIKVPRHKFQPTCNNRLFDVTCGLTQSDYGYTGTATGGTIITLVDTTRGTSYKVAFDTGDSSTPVEVGDTITGSVAAYTAVVTQITYLDSTTGYIWYVELSDPTNFADDEILTGGGNTVTVNGTPAENKPIYEQGELEMTSGSNSGHSRQILLSSTDTLTVSYPFPAAISAGDTYVAYPGCNGKASTCKNTFNNKTNFRGFLYGPRIEETIF